MDKKTKKQHCLCKKTVNLHFLHFLQSNLAKMQNRTSDRASCSALENMKNYRIT